MFFTYKNVQYCVGQVFYPVWSTCCTRKYVTVIHRILINIIYMIIVCDSSIGVYKYYGKVTPVQPGLVIKTLCIGNTHIGKFYT